MPRPVLAGVVILLLALGGILAQAVSTPSEDAPAVRATDVPTPSDPPPDIPSPRPRIGGAIVGEVRRGAEPVAATITAARLGPLPSGPGDQLDALLEEDRPEPMASAIPGEDGRFVLGGLTSGRYELTAATPDGVRTGAVVSLPVDGATVEATLRIPWLVAPLAGRAVHENGRPFRGTVALRPEGAPDPLPRPLRTRTDAEGRFAFAGLPHGTYRPEALVAGQFRSQGLPLELPRHAGIVFRVDIGVREVRAEVRDADRGGPVAGATVTAMHRRNGVLHHVSRAVTDERGEAALGVLRGEVELTTSADGFARLDERHARIRDVVRLRLRRPGRIEGRVTTASGASVGGLEVRTLDTPAHAVCDDDGRFALDGVPPGLAQLEATGRGWASAEPVLVEAGGPRAPVTLVVGPGGRIEGRIRADGRPVPGAVVRLARRRAQEIETTTGPDGAFAFGSLAPGFSHRVRAEAAGRAPARSDPVLVLAGETARVDLDLPATREVVVTTLDAATGRPVAGAAVRLIRVEDRRPAGAERTGPDGRAVFPGAPPDPCVIHVSHPALASPEDRLHVVPADGRLDLRLEPGLSISGRILGPGGAPLRQGRVTSIDFGGITTLIRPEDEGRFRLDGLPPGSYGLWISSSRRRSFFEPPDLFAAGTAGVEILLPRGSRDDRPHLSFRVRDDRGRPVEHLVFRTGQRHDWMDTWEPEEPERSGSRIGLPRHRVSGDTRLEIHHALGRDGRRLGATFVGPLDPEDRTREVRLPGSRSMSGLVLDPGGAAAPGVRVTATALGPDAAGPWSVHGEAVSDDEGRFEIDGLGRGVYRLDPSGPAGRARGHATRARGGERDVVVRLRTTVAVVVTVREEGGAPVVDATVCAWRRRQAIRAQTDRAGRARLPGLLPDEDHHLEVEAAWDRPEHFPVRLADWRPRDETVTLRRALTIRGVLRDATGGPPTGKVRLSWSTAAGGDAVAVRPDGSFVAGPLSPGEIHLYGSWLDALTNAFRNVDVRIPAGSRDVVLRPDDD